MNAAELEFAMLEDAIFAIIRWHRFEERQHQAAVLDPALVAEEVLMHNLEAENHATAARLLQRALANPDDLKRELTEAVAKGEDA